MTVSRPDNEDERKEILIKLIRSAKNLQNLVTGLNQSPLVDNLKSDIEKNNKLLLQLGHNFRTYDDAQFKVNAASLTNELRNLTDRYKEAKNIRNTDNQTNELLVDIAIEEPKNTQAPTPEIMVPKKHPSNTYRQNDEPIKQMRKQLNAIKSHYNTEYIGTYFGDLSNADRQEIVKKADAALEKIDTTKGNHVDNSNILEACILIEQIPLIVKPERGFMNRMFNKSGFLETKLSEIRKAVKSHVSKEDIDIVKESQRRAKKEIKENRTLEKIKEEKGWEKQVEKRGKTP